MEKTSRSRYSILNVSSSVVGQVITILFGFVIRTVFIYTLGKSYLGISGLFQNVLQILSVADLGLGTAISFSLYKPLVDKDEEKVNQIVHLYRKTYRIIGVIIFAAGVSVMPILPYIVGEKSDIINIYLVYFLFLIQTVSSYLLFSYRKTLYDANQRAYKAVVKTFSIKIVGYIIQILALVIAKNYYVYLSVEIAMVVATNIVIGICAAKEYPFIKTKPKQKLPVEDLTVIKKNIFGSALYKICGVVTNSTSNLLISIFVGIDIVGIYSNYLLITNYIRIFLSLVFNGITASVGNLHVKGTKEHNEFVFKCTNFLNYWICGFCGIAFFCLINPFISIWLRDDTYLLPKTTVFLIFIYLVLVGLQYLIESYRSACGLFWKGKKRPVFTVIINLSLSILLGKYMGLNGIIIASIVSNLLTIMWYDPVLIYKEVFKKSSIVFFAKYVFNFILIVSCATALEYMLSYIPTTIGFFLLKMVIVTIVPNIIFFLIYFRTKEFKYIVDRLAKPFLSKLKKKTQ